MMEETSEALPSRRTGGWNVFVDPFYYLSGGPAMMIGLAIILVTGALGWLSRTNHLGVLDLMTGRPTPMWFSLTQGIVDWFILAVLLYGVGRFTSRSRTVRVVDVFGGQALARAPYLIATLMTLPPGYSRSLGRLMANGFDWRALGQNGVDGFLFLAALTVGLAMLVWMVALMYRSYAHACHLKGVRAGAGFVATLAVAEVLSQSILSAGL